MSTLILIKDNQYGDVIVILLGPTSERLGLGLPGSCFVYTNVQI